MIEWLRTRLVPEAGEWWRMGSVQLAAGVAAIGGAVTANPDVLLSLVAFLPAAGPWRPLLVALVVITLFVVPTLTRLWQQGRTDPVTDSGENGDGQ